MTETLSSIEPLLFDHEIPRRLSDLACLIQDEASRLEQALPADAAREIAGLVRHAGGFDADLIEEPLTLPDGSEVPLDGRAPTHVELSQAEARSELAVLQAIDEAHAAGTLASPTSTAFLTWAHRSVYEAMAASAGGGSDPRSGRRAPGLLRDGSEQGGDRGDPLPHAPERVGLFLAHFERRFSAAERWPSARIIAIAAAHHRFDLIRPFPYGNARVGRLMSHAMVMRASIGGGGLWSMSRGLARRCGGEYRLMMRQAASRRTSEGDGRGQLSASALVGFSEWMLSVMLDEVRFARASFAPQTLEPRYRRLLRALDYDANAQDLAAAILRFGQIDRGDACVVLKTSERTARTALSRLVGGGFLRSETPKGPVRIAFPPPYRNHLFPQVFARSPDDPLSLPASSIGPAAAWIPAPPRAFSATATAVTRAPLPVNPGASGGVGIGGRSAARSAGQGRA